VIETRPRTPALLNYLSLFTSVGTLLCCALPSLLVLLGLGTTVASFLTAMPFLVTMSRHKQWIFVIAGVLIALSFVYLYRIAPRLQAAACPSDRPAACEVASRFSKVALWASAVLYAIGAFVAFALGPILQRLE
jgi:nitrate/nitrite transporter NarK